MTKANRICYCCGREYYFCPSCPKDRKDPQIYTMWDSEICRDIFNTLSRESLKKITTKECKEKLIELCIDKVEINKESVKNHINRVMSYEDVEVAEKQITEAVVETSEIAEAVEILEEENTSEVIEVIEVIEELVITEETTVEPKTFSKKRKGSLRNKEN